MPNSITYVFKQNMKMLLSRVIRVGVLEKDRRIDSFGKILTNSMSLIGIILNALVFITYLFVKPQISFIYFFTTIIFIFPIFLNHKGYYKSASLSILTWNAFIILGMSLIGGFSIEIHPLLIVITFSGSLLFLSFSQAFLFNVVLLVSFFFTKHFSNEIGPIIQQEVFSLREYLNFSIAMIAAFILARFILNNVIKYLTTLEKTLEHLKDTNKKIATQNQRLELFNTIATHDLKTPIRNVTSFVSLAKRNLTQQNVSAKTIEHLDMALSYSNRMNELVSSMSNLNNIKQVENEEVVEVELCPFIHTTLPYYQSQTLKQVSIHCSDDIKFKARLSHCKIIMDNLLTNAIKYNEHHDVIINISLVNGESYSQILISDNGIGISPEYQNTIFDPFKKLHSTDKYEGTGLGLYIVKEILALYKGSISAHSNSKRGTTFIIQIPK